MSKEKRITQHSFLVDDAKDYDIESAIILYNIRFWLEKNKSNKHNIRDGRVWTYNSLSSFEELFPYMSKSTIYRRLNKMEEDGIILKGNFNDWALDRTIWYSINEKQYEVPISQPEQMDISSRTNGYSNGETTIPDNNPDITSQDIKQDVEDLEDNTSISQDAENNSKKDWNLKEEMERTTFKRPKTDWDY